MAAPVHVHVGEFGEDAGSPSLSVPWWVRLMNLLAASLDSPGRIFFVVVVVVVVVFSRAAPAAYGGSQARGLIRAVAAGLHQSHSNLGSELSVQPYSFPTNVPPNGLTEGPRKVAGLRTLNLPHHLLQELFLRLFYSSPNFQAKQPKQTFLV